MTCKISRLSKRPEETPAFFVSAYYSQSLSLPDLFRQSMVQHSRWNWRALCARVGMPLVLRWITGTSPVMTARRLVIAALVAAIHVSALTVLQASASRARIDIPHILRWIAGTSPAMTVIGEWRNVRRQGLLRLSPRFKTLRNSVHRCDLRHHRAYVAALRGCIRRLQQKVWHSSFGLV